MCCLKTSGRDAVGLVAAGGGRSCQERMDSMTDAAELFPPPTSRLCNSGFRNLGSQQTGTGLLTDLLMFIKAN